MMKFVTGNLFNSDAEALVNTVNTVGIMGKGVALKFKERFPMNYDLYAAACRRGEVEIGKMFVTPTNSMMNPKWIINFPTKKHWRHKSSYVYIESGLNDLVEQIIGLEIKSLAIPPLGAGHGGLKWEKVKQMLEAKLSTLQINITVFEPTSQLEHDAKFEKTRLTKPRALVLALINQYRKLGYDITLLEIQKLAYFLQRLGQSDLNLKYKEYLYGPYAHNLQHLLHELEKGYLRSEKSVLDSKPLDLIYLNNEIVDEVSHFIEKQCSAEEKERLSKVFKLMSGFESPFGLELLASVDWVLQANNADDELSPENVREKIKKWSHRKAKNFNQDHIVFAYNRLKVLRMGNCTT